MIKNKKAEEAEGGINLTVLAVVVVLVLGLITGVIGAFRVQEAISAMPSWLWIVIGVFLLFSLLKGGKRR